MIMLIVFLEMVCPFEFPESISNVVFFNVPNVIRFLRIQNIRTISSLSGYFVNCD